MNRRQFHTALMGIPWFCMLPSCSPPTAAAAIKAGQLFVDALTLLCTAYNLYNQVVSEYTEDCRSRITEAAQEPNPTNAQRAIANVAKTWEKCWKDAQSKADDVKKRIADVESKAKKYFSMLEKIASGINDVEIRASEQARNKEAANRWGTALARSKVEIEKIIALQTKGEDLKRMLLGAALRSQVDHYTKQLDALTHEASRIADVLANLVAEGKSLVVTQEDSSTEAMDTDTNTQSEWTPGTRHSEYPNVIAGEQENHWRPAPGYKFINENQNDLRVEVAE